MELEERLKYARNIINNYIYKEKDFARLYPFTTENLNGYMSKYNLKNKTVLTVGSSSDQIFNAHMMGAKKIVCFDTNPLCEDYFNLKSAAFKSLDYEEFIIFFCNFIESHFKNNKSVFNEKTFYKVLPYLSDESYYFWMSLFNSYSGLKIRKRLFCDDEEELRVLTKANSFMSKSGYYIMKEKIEYLNPSFITCDLRNIDNNILGKFDYILLSNIACFIQKMYSNPLHDFRNDILKLKKSLNDDGVMFLAYLYDMRENTVIKPTWDLIYHLEKVFSVFENDNISKERFIGIKGLIHDDEIFTDMVLTLKK